MPRYIDRSLHNVSMRKFFYLNYTSQFKSTSTKCRPFSKVTLGLKVLFLIDTKKISVSSLRSLINVIDVQCCRPQDITLAPNSNGICVLRSRQDGNLDVIVTAGGKELNNKKNREYIRENGMDYITKIAYHSHANVRFSQLNGNLEQKLKRFITFKQ